MRNTTKFDDIQANEMRKKYEAGGTVEGLAKEYHTTASTVCRTIRRVGGTIRTTAYRTKGFTNEVAKEMRLKYEAGATLQDLVNEYGTYRSTISRTLKNVGTQIRTHDNNKGRKLGRRKPAKGLLSWLAS